MTKPLVQIAFNPSVAKIVGGDAAARDIVANELSYFVDGYEHTNAFQSKRWDGRSTMFKYGNDTFPAGFVPIVIQTLSDKGYQVQRVCRPLPAPLGPERPEIPGFPYSDRYDYQPETVSRLLKHGMMIARIATGGGKSQIARIAYARINRPTLLLTTRKGLLYQMKRGFEATGFACGLIGDSEWDPNPMLNVAMIQTLAQRLEEPDEFDSSPAAMRQRRVRERTLEFLAQFEFIIGEEAHEASGDSYFTVIRACKNAAYRLALTATPFMKGDSEANFRLMAAFGQVGIDVTEKLLIERGILARPVFKIVRQPSAPSKLRATTAWQRAYELGIVENDWRNHDMVEKALAAREFGLTTMLLVIREKHGKSLLALMKAAGLRAKFIWGESNQAARDKALEELGRGQLDVLIGSNILDVGIDVPSVGQIILGGGMKAEVATRQRIGRGLREKKSGPNVCPVIDYSDHFNKHTSNHAKTRLEILKSTPGFVENILPANDEIDFEALGFTKQRLAA